MRVNIQNSFVERSISWFAMAVLFLNLTNLYALLSGITGVPFRLVGMAFIAILGIGLVINRQNTMLVLSSKPFIVYVVLFAAVPVISMFNAPVPIFRLAGYVVLSLLIFLFSVTWIMQNGWDRFCKIIFYSWLVGVFFVILSYFLPASFSSIAMMQEVARAKDSIWSETSVAQADQGRAFGLYMQSNRACLALSMHLLILLPTFLHSRHLLRMVVLGVTFFAILLSGSRGGALYMLVITALLFGCEMFYGIRKDGRVLSGISILPSYMILTAVTISALVLAMFFGQKASAEQSPVQRIIESYFSGEVDFMKDSSVQARLYTQEIYVSKILKSPLLGHGLGSSFYERYVVGTLPLTSHNAYLETAYRYGLPVMASVYGFFFYLTRQIGSWNMRRYFRYNISWMFLIFIGLASMVTESVFNYRVFPVVMAFWMAMIFFPTAKPLRFKPAKY